MTRAIARALADSQNEVFWRADPEFWSRAFRDSASDDESMVFARVDGLT